MTPEVANDPLLLFLALAFAHILSDFPWQTDRMVAQKRQGARDGAELGSGRFIGYIKHGSVLLATSIIFASPWWSWRVIAAVFIVSFAHLLLDYLQCRYLSEPTVSIRLGDQAIHFLIIFAALNVTGVYAWEVAGYRLETFWQSYRYPAAIISSGYVISIWVAGVLVRTFLSTIGPFGGVDEGLRDAGKRIGQLERFLVTTLTILDQYSAIAFVFAAKSIARFKKIEETPTFAEYYLAGTLASVSLGILAGLGIKAGLTLLGQSQ